MSHTIRSGDQMNDAFKVGDRVILAQTIWFYSTLGVDFSQAVVGRTYTHYKMLPGTRCRITGVGADNTFIVRFDEIDELVRVWPDAIQRPNILDQIVEKI